MTLTSMRCAVDDRCVAAKSATGIGVPNNGGAQAPIDRCRRFSFARRSAGAHAPAFMAGGVGRASALPVPSFRHANPALLATLIGVGLASSIKTKEPAMSAYSHRVALALPPLSVREERAIARVSSLIERRARLSRQSFSTPAVSGDFFRMRLGALEYEVFEVAFLDNGHSLIACETMFRGTVNAAQVHVREVIRRALILNACVLVIAHNHPSGNTKPSKADIAVTNEIIKAGRMMEITLIDHIIVGGEKALSFAYEGLL